MKTTSILTTLLALGTVTQAHQQLQKLSCNSNLDLAGPSAVTWEAWRSSYISNGVAKVPCGKAVVLKKGVTLPSSLTGLHVEGWLKIEDDTDRIIQAEFIVVEGHLFVGEASKPFSHQLEFVLKQPANPRDIDLSSVSSTASGNIGMKPFVVAGGQVSLFGMSSDCKTWTRLVETAFPEHNTIRVDGDLTACWKPGQEIALASTDFEYLDAEQRTLVSLHYDSSTKSTTLEMNSPLGKNHWGKSFQVGDKSINEAGEVALLTRSIKVRGETAPNNELHGGHFMILATGAAQTIQGVEFVSMGQQGTLGRYPIHFHMCLDTAGKSLVSHNSVHHTHQRCVVVHGTHNLKVSENVAFKTKGHCFMLEDGIEYGNVFFRNLGFVNEPVKHLIDQAEGNTDDRPSTFWITNPNNTWIENVAAGSETGFWFELGNIRGPSSHMPGASDINTKEVPLKMFHRNVAHSNHDHGLRTYPKGYRPPKVAVFSEFVSFKNQRSGIFAHVTNSIEFQQAVVADNTYGVEFDEVQDSVLRDSLIIGETDNVGNPTDCHEETTWGNCKATGSCSLPAQYLHLVDPAHRATTPIGRSIPRGGGYRHLPIYGFLFTEDSPLSWNDDRGGNLIVNNEFAHFDDLGCRRSAAFSVDSAREEGKFLTSHTIGANTLQDGVTLIHFDERPFWKGFHVSKTRGSAVWQVAINVQDGFLVSPNQDIVDPSRCTLNEKWNGYHCKDVCFQTIGFQVDVYPNSSFPALFDSPSEFEDLRLILTWTDSQGTLREISLIPFFSLDDDTSFDRDHGLTFTANLLSLRDMGIAGGYTVRFEGPNASKFQNRAMRVRFLDPARCSTTPMEFHFPETDLFQYRTVLGQAPVHCDTYSSTLTTPFRAKNMYEDKCTSAGADLVTLHLNPAAHEEVVFELAPGTPQSCDSTKACQVVYQESEWKYLNDGSNQHPSLLRPIGFAHYLYPDGSWLSGHGELGYNDNDEVTNIDHPDRGLTAYFRKTVNLKNTACIEKLVLGVRYDEGVRVFLNGVAVLNQNLPEGRVAFDDRALEWYDGEREYAYFTLSGQQLDMVAEGDNILAAELHQRWNSDTEDASFDMEIVAYMTKGCTGPKRREEVCDGLDNDADGKVDEDDNGNPLTRPCYTPCGAGIETCTAGRFAGCTARMPEPEVCDGIDNNCDGIVDNAHDLLWQYILQYREASPRPETRLDCAAGESCFLGKCVPIVEKSHREDLFRPKSMWAYWDAADSAQPAGWPLPSAATLAAAQSGFGELGFNDGDEDTVVGKGEKPITTYFAKTFTTDRAFYEMEMGLLCDAGCIVYLNGVEIHRVNLPASGVTSQTLATASGSETSYKEFIVGEETLAGVVLTDGSANVLTVEVHRRWGDMSFDAFATVETENLCSDSDKTSSRGDTVALTGQGCVVNKTVSILPGKSTWKYTDTPQDSTVAFEAFGPMWAPAGFDDSNWKSGQAFIGFGRWYLDTDTGAGSSGEQPPMTMYFRKKITVDKPHCIMSFQPLVWAEDSAVVYVNGHEVLRRNLLLGDLQNTDSATDYGKGYVVTDVPQYSGNYFVQGENTIAVEVHRHKWSWNMGFDFGIDAHYDTNCLKTDATPVPVQAATRPPTLVKIETLSPTRFPTPSPTPRPSV